MTYTGDDPRTTRITTLYYETPIPYLPDQFMTVGEAAKFAKCSPSKIRNLYRDHPIAKNVIGKIMVSKAELQSLIDGPKSVEP